MAVHYARVRDVLSLTGASIFLMCCSFLVELYFRIALQLENHQVYFIKNSKCVILARLKVARKPALRVLGQWVLVSLLRVSLWLR